LQLQQQRQQQQQQQHQQQQQQQGAEMIIGRVRLIRRKKVQSTLAH
jgi:hypothetical protein